MANVTALGNQIFINQNMSVASAKYSNALARLTSQDVINSDNFEENCKRLKETRDPEATNEIDEHLTDDAVYSVREKYKRRHHRENGDEHEEKKHLIDEKRKKIDVTI
jgi:hypothetical protein